MENEPTWLTAQSPEAIERLLRQRGLLSASEQLTSVSSAGAGNMNVTLRVQIDGDQRRSLIVKQSRPYVAKYDFIPAPVERANFESLFYQFVGDHQDVAGSMPRLVDWIEDQYVLVLEDLGAASDATTLYRTTPEKRDRMLGELLPPLIQWLGSLHTASANALWNADAFQNTALRRLNHEHIFEIPFRSQPAIDLDAVTPGLANASIQIRTDKELFEIIAVLGKQYLAGGGRLLHGDFYPGSWLQTQSGPKVIDPEFCFAGPPEFDWSVLIAHLQMCGVANAIENVRRLMTEESQLDWKLVEAFSGVEILRRILGVAQLPLTLDLSEKKRLLASAAEGIRALRHSSSREDD